MKKDIIINNIVKLLHVLKSVEKFKAIYRGIIYSNYQFNAAVRSIRSI